MNQEKTESAHLATNSGAKGHNKRRGTIVRKLQYQKHHMLNAKENMTEESPVSFVERLTM